MAGTFTSATTATLYPPSLFGAKGLPTYGSFNAGVYATGGVDTTFTAAVIGCSVDGSVRYVFDPSTSKMLAFNSLGNEILDTTDLSAANFNAPCLVMA